MPSGTSFAIGRSPRLGSSGRVEPLPSWRPASPSRGTSCTCGPGRGSSSPGASSVPAKSEPIMTTSRRPAAMRLHNVARVLDPAVRDHGDAVLSGRPPRSRSTAVTCGTPTPATIRVVQIDPGPMPDLHRVHARRDQRLRRPLPVATFPATIGQRRRSSMRFLERTASSTALRVPVRRVDHDQVDPLPPPAPATRVHRGRHPRTDRRADAQAARARP
jgi:hypothetical protein